MKFASIPITFSRLLVLLLIVVGLLSIPLISMQFSEAFQWDALDFAVMGVLLTLVLLLGDLILRRVQSPQSKVLLLLALFVLFLLIWAELAVGIFGWPL